MNHRSHLWLMAALAGVGLLAVVLLPGGSILPLAFGIPLLACLAMLAAMFFLMRGMGRQPSAEVDDGAPAREPASADVGGQSGPR
jgi:hypothetical protein